MIFVILHTKFRAQSVFYSAHKTLGPSLSGKLNPIHCLICKFKLKELNSVLCCVGSVVDRKYFFRIRISRSVILNYGSSRIRIKILQYREIFVPNERKNDKMLNCFLKFRQIFDDIVRIRRPIHYGSTGSDSTTLKSVKFSKLLPLYGPTTPPR